MSLAVGLCSAALSVLVGVPLGLLAGYRRGRGSSGSCSLADVLQSFPSIVLVLCLVTLAGPSASTGAGLGLLGWTDIARLVYGNTLSVREQEYVLAARAPGGADGADPPAQCAAQCDLAGVVRLPPAGGPGHPVRVQPQLSGRGHPHPPGLLGQPDPIRRQPARAGGPALGVVPPAACMLLTVFCLQGVGDGLRDALDPRGRAGQDGKRPCRVKSNGIQKY